MALIKCPECGRDVSDKAFTCPYCGNPFKGQSPINIEQTKKKWKILKIAALLLSILGAYLIIMGLLGKNLEDFRFWIGVSVEFIALVLALTGKIGAWWNNR
ncbi:MAG: hypothetical protein V1891_03370 [bacterium]